MKPIIKSQEKYDNIVNILKVEYTIVYSSKHTKYYLKRKAELFILFENLPLLKDTENGHKRVFMEETVLSMKIEVKKLHNQNRYGQNRLYELYKQRYFSIPRCVVRKVCNRCNTCLQA